MAQAATPEAPGLPCSPKQALAMYQLLFRRPAGPGRLWAALRQVQEGRYCPPEQALPTVLLEMERSQRAQEQLLWDLELLTGAGLGLFWPPWSHFRYQRHQAQDTWSQQNQPLGRMGGDPGQQDSRLYPSPQAEDSQSQNHQLTEGGQTPSPSSASDLGEARSDTDPRQESPGMPEKATPGSLQEMNPTSSRCFEEPGNPPFKDLAQREERSQVEPMIQRPDSLGPRNPRDRKLCQEAPGPSSLASQVLLAQDPPKGLGLGLHRKRSEPQKLLLLDSPQGLRETVPGENKEVPPSQGGKPPQGQSGEDPEGQREVPEGANTDAPQSQTQNSPKCLQEEAPQSQKVKIWQTWEVEVAQGEATAQSLEERDPLGQRSVERRGPGPGGRTAQRGQTQAQSQQLAVARLGVPPEEARAPAPGPGAGIPATQNSGGAERPELPGGLAQQAVEPTSFPGVLGEQRGSSGGPPASKAAWPTSPGVSAAQQDSALRRLLELHGAARRRRRRDREQQRLRVLERLRIVGNRHCRVHPLGLPSGHAPPESREDMAGWRRALREQLDQANRERSGRLRALGARNTKNFQELLLWPAGAEHHVPRK